MLKPPKPANEAARLAALKSLQVLDTPAEERFDRITRLAARLLDVPIALISLVDSDRQWFKSKYGLDASETPREVSFCGHAILQDEPLLVPDASLDPRFADNPLVAAEPRIRFYAGHPLEAEDGCKLGTLCLIDTRPRQLSEADRQCLHDLAMLAQQELCSITLQQTWREKSAVEEELRRSHDLLDAISRTQSRFIAAADPVPVFNELLSDFLALTNSEYGFIGEIFYTGDNQPYMQTHAITNLAWNDETRAFYDDNIATGLKFYNLNTLFGRVMATGEPMIANHPASHPHRGGIPEGHPPLNAFLGLPLYSGDTLVGMAGLANRPGGYDEKLIAHLQPMTNTCANLIQAHRTDRQRHGAEESLRTSQQQLQTVLDNLTSVVYVKDLQGRTLLVNNEGARRLGLDRQSIIGKTEYELFPKEIADTLHARDKVALDAKAVVSGEETLPLDGKLHTFLSTRYPLFDASGNIYALCGTATDITERKKTEEELRESETRMRAILDNVLDGIITINDVGTIESLNPAAEKIFGYPAAEVTGKNVKMLMPEPYHSGHDGYLGNYISGGDAKVIGIGREVTGLRKDGSTFPMDLAVSGIQLGERRMFTGIVRDITERKKIDRMKNEFVSVVSHELRTPLTSILGSLGLIAGGVAGALPVQAKSLIDIAHNNSERLVRLINDILDIEKIESGKMAFDFQPTEIAPLVEEALQANQSYAAQYGVGFRLDQRAFGVKALADRDRLMQVMANLLSNAAKYSPPDNVVTVSLSHRGRVIHVEVTDRGPGIPAEFHSRIFQKFAQADSSDTRQKSGTGLGLSISKAIVEKHGGQIGFTTGPNGTTFYFDLPEWKEMAEPAVNEPASSQARILVCEDDTEVANQLATALAENGIACDIAYTANQARRLLAQRRYTAMTLDLVLPDADGMELIRELRASEATRDLPVIVLSVKPRPGQAELEGGAVEVVDWLNKPLDEQRLVNLVKHAMHRAPTGKPRLLCVEDDAGMRRVLSAVLQNTAEVACAGTLSEARRLLTQERYDLVILDIGLPDGSGLELLPLLKSRADTPHTPAIIFSAQEVGTDIAREVEAVLIKSRVSNQDLVKKISAVIDTNRNTETSAVR